MFESLLFIAVPALFILCGTVAALSFARDPEEADATMATARPDATTAPSLAARPTQTTELFRPRPKQLIAEKEELTFDELIASIEAHLRTEREAAKAYIHHPSTEALWVN